MAKRSTLTKEVWSFDTSYVPPTHRVSTEEAIEHYATIGERAVERMRLYDKLPPELRAAIAEHGRLKLAAMLYLVRRWPVAKVITEIKTRPLAHARLIWTEQVPANEISLSDLDL